MPAWITAILVSFAKFLGWKEAKEKNAPLHEHEQLDREDAKLRADIVLAARAGNIKLVRELQNKITDNNARRATLGNAGRDSGK